MLLGLAAVAGLAGGAWLRLGASAPGGFAATVPDPAEAGVAMALVDDFLRRRPFDRGAVVFEATVEMTGPFGASQFSARVDKTGNQAQVTLSGVPWYVPRAFTATFGDLGEMLRDFEMAYERTEGDGDRVVYVITGTHRKPTLTAARSGTVWIDGRLREVVRAHFVYVWGSVDSRFEYGRCGARLVVARQETSVSPLGLRLTARYHSFRWPQETPPHDRCEVPLTDD